ncbi:MAG: glutamate-5-semialdehyde dehydrogenase [Deltaproteobacteria bacterium]|nr:glutamate-5-semialdehyde dehydrogenase [Deltaproteobacteria bacterium]MCB9787258.1 glutamate-5-semialdehyde dehydrogenase [Deltaproteobacteria bacterium]
MASAARAASRALGRASSAQRDRVLERLAALLTERQDELVAANTRDLEAADAAGVTGALRDRLALTPARIAAMAEGVRQVMALPDPLGGIERLARRPNGLMVGRMRIPLGVICIIYESRPNVTVDAGALCLKSGNAPILKGGKEAIHSNAALVALMREALADAGLPADCVQAVATSDRAVTDALIRCSGDVDLVIPRGGEALIRHVTEHATVPVIQHYKGVCHVYLDRDCDLEMATEIAFNAKVQRPGVCNAMETLLVHRDLAPRLIPRLFPRLEAAGVTLRADARTRALWPAAQAATEADWDTEYLDLVLSVRLVDDMDVALDHIARYGSGHTEAIVTNQYASGQRFLREVTASCVLINASTRFNDGFELGLGAEIGISTSRLHAYGAMGLEELTARKWIVYGEGQVRG